MVGRSNWTRGEIYELVCLVLVGTCLWFVGIEVGLFESMNGVMLRYHLSSLVMLCLIMGVVILAASIRKSFNLRQAMLQHEAAATQAEVMARHDVLTGLANRRFFLETVAARLPALDDASGVVLLIDLDRFKPVNDIYGHAAGNAVLRAVADRLQALLGPLGVAARLGGDEFAMLVDVADRDGIARLAQQVITQISTPIRWNGNDLKVGATVGVAVLSAEQADAEEVLHAADLAMYQGKKDGRGTFRVFERAMEIELKTRALLETELRDAIEAGAIEPFYQPVVSLPEKAMIGVEVLARWRHPVRGLLPPSAFIAIAEETNMIVGMSYRLLRQACLDARTWPDHLTLAVNISPQQFQDRWLSERILAILTETGFPPRRLEIEVTETALVKDLEATRAILTSLQNLGVRIALDDFGTGYSSLYHLRELKFDKLKIDSTYVDAMTMSGERAKLVNATIQLGASLGLVTTAEGIESDAILEWLAGQGCGFGQGYLFGGPMPRDEMDALLKAKIGDTPASVPSSKAA